MKFFRIIILTVLVFTFFSCKKNQVDKSNNINITIITKKQLVEKKIIPLKSKWNFYWKKYLISSHISSNNYKPDSIVNVPGAWKNYKSKNVKFSEKGFGTYHLVLEMSGCEYEDISLLIHDIGTSYNLYINNNFIAHQGNPGNSKKNTVPRMSYDMYPVNLIDGKIDIIIQVANFHHRNGGIWDDVSIGLTHYINKKIYMDMSLDLFICGILFIMGLYHFSIFYFRTKEKSSLYFGIFCLIFSFRTSVVNSRFLHMVYEGNIWPFLFKTEIATFYLVIPVFSMMVYSLYKKYFNEKVKNAILAAGGIFSILSIILPVYLVSKSLIYYEVIALVIVSYLLFVVVKAAIKRQITAITFLVTMVIAFTTMILDILQSGMILNIRQTTPIGLVIMVFLQSIILSKKYSQSLKNVEDLTDDLFQTNISYSRFVPREILKFLNKKSIKDVELGDFSEKKMTVMFADIREFTNLSENMTPSENFKFLNSYLNRMGPIIRTQGGIIDKYVGDAIMALFPLKPEWALDAAIAIRRELIEYNKQRSDFGYEPLDIGIGIHTGNIIVGTIGEAQRMDGTVISDTVNSASRLEELTKIGAPIIISNITLFDLERSNDYCFRFLGQVFVKGKMKQIAVYEIFDFESDEQIELKNSSKLNFEHGILCLYNENYKEAKKIFKKICKDNPEDKPANFYLKMSEHKQSIPFHFSENMLENCKKS